LRIKKLELVGFKSFKDKTVIHFDAGITGIVGPNGCGKSNIVDALVWVMGEMSAKDLRGSTMTDVIFAGSEDYAPSGLSEVSLTLENDGGPFPIKYIKHSEVMVTRRLHRNGESEYFINKEIARLRDVQEIFMDTGAGSKGFSIIQQGMIGKIITSKPEDRRHLIEEAAGITKFKARKKESQRKLVATEQNLVRLQDIIGELKRQIDSLQRQAQRAERYRQIKNQIEDLDVWLSSLQYVELAEVAKAAQVVFQESQSSEVEGEAQLSSLQTQLEQLRLSLLELEKSTEEKVAQHSQKQAEVQKKELQLQELKFEIEQSRRNEVMTGSLLQEQQARREFLIRDLDQLNESATALREEYVHLETDSTSKSESYSQAQEKISQVDEQLTTERQKLFAIGNLVSSLEAKIQSLQSQIEDLNEKSEKENIALSEYQDKKTEFENHRKKIANQLEIEKQLHLDLSSDTESIQANKKILIEQLDAKKNEVEVFKDNLNEVTGKLYGLQNLHQNFEGFSEGVKQVMLWQKAKQAEITADGSVHFQPVSEVVEVPADYELAMESALGSRLQMLFSSNAQSAVDAVEHLKQSNGGRGSFYVDTDTKTNSIYAEQADRVKSEEGVQGVLKDLVKSSEKYSTSVSFLLSGVAVVDRLMTAIKLRSIYPDWTFVTQDGDTLSADGILTGGSKENAETGVLKRRREIKELSEQKDEWAGKLALAQAALKKVESQLSSITTDLEGAQQRKLDQEIKLAELKKDFERAENECSQVEHTLEKQKKEVSQIQQQLLSLNEKLTDFQAQHEQALQEKQQKDDLCKELIEDLNQTRSGFDDLQSEATQLQVKTAEKKQELQGVERQLEMVNKSLTDLDFQLSKMSEESEKNSSIMTENQIKLEEEKVHFERLVREVEELRLVSAQQKDQYEKSYAEVRQIEDQVRSAQDAKNQRQHKMNEAQLKFEQSKLKEQYLVDQVREKYQLNLPDIYEQYIGRDSDVNAANDDLKELRDKLSKIGEVNLTAIDEYSETAKRYEFLSQQQTDLVNAKEQLKKVIERINKICTKRFTETFNLVNDRFVRVFPVLFGGGEARLEIVEDPEKQEMGIEIIAKPPGKKMQNVSLLSGGEKALTAVSLVFSIFLVKPSPYCLLDEVDAPLDDANVFRFNDLVKEMAKRSQIIVVTHNKHTMEVAKKLYGVTMQERGVSTMVSVNLADVG